VAAKAYVVLEFTSPRKPEGIYEGWLDRASKNMPHFNEMVKAAGGGEYRILADLQWNTPSNMLVIDFESSEKALAFVVMPEFLSWLESFRKDGALDMGVRAYRLWTR